MSNRNKLKKFAEILTFPNVYENVDMKNPRIEDTAQQVIEMKGKWNEKHFKNDHPITLELACGRGEYTLQLARKYPNRNFIGVDIKGARIWQGAKIALEEKLDNAAFLRTRIELIEHFFTKGEVSEIWITFPDPFLRNSKSNRRLTSPPFLDRYQKFLDPAGFIHLKTDSPELYEFTLETESEYDKIEMLYNDDDIYSKQLPMAELDFKTYYEKMHLANGKTIKYVRLKYV
ncbi:MAG: tRNA (guanosine(46)-N7)-methyltransferase TrmB [Saprospiraceae bacterium]